MDYTVQVPLTHARRPKCCLHSPPHVLTRVYSAEINGSPWVLWWGAMFGSAAQRLRNRCPRNRLTADCGEV